MSSEKTANAAPVDVMLRVWAEHDDESFYAEREAPALPSGVSWHKGMWWYDDVDGMEVESVDVNALGSVTVRFHERYRSPIGPITVGVRIEDPNWQLLCQLSAAMVGRLA